MDMIKVSSSGLKAKLGKYMRAVRAGQEVLVTDREQPVARLVPVRSKEPSRSIQASAHRALDAPPLGQVSVRGIRHHRGIDTTSLLQEDRRR
jgi:prevent-host-death family protein